MVEKSSGEGAKPEPTNHFTRQVMVKSAQDGAAGSKRPDRDLGLFTFQLATYRDLLRIEQRRGQYMGGVAPAQASVTLLMLAEYAATLPLVVVSAPFGWPKKLEEWDARLDTMTEVDLPEYEAIYTAYREGVRTFRDGESP